MVLNYIWIAFFAVAFVIALIKLIFMGDVSVFPAIMDSTFETSKTALKSPSVSLACSPFGSA